MVNMLTAGPGWVQASPGSLRTLKAASPTSFIDKQSCKQCCKDDKGGPQNVNGHHRRTTALRQHLATRITVTDRFLLAKGMGFEIYHGICLRVWHYLSICYQQGYSHFSQGQVGGMMKPCLCPASLHQFMGGHQAWLWL